MRHFTTFMISIAMIAFTGVSMWTTYLSLSDSILPGPKVMIPYGAEEAMPLVIPALALSVGIGVMLLGMKFAIINERRKLGVLGFVGLFIIAFISISFNLDVLYRIANADFEVRNADQKMRAVYDSYLAEVQGVLGTRESEIKRGIARQQGELESEIQGLREAPAGFGDRAKAEQYELNLLEREAEVDLEAVQAALAAKELADEALMSARPQSIDDVLALETEIRVIVKDVGAVAGIMLPEPVEIEMPIFAVFSRMFDMEQVGFMEVFLLVIAVFLDLGDIVGFNLVARKALAPAGATPTGGGGLQSPIPDQQALPAPDPAMANDLDDEDRAVSKAKLKPNGPRPSRGGIRFNRGWSVYRG